MILRWLLPIGFLGLLGLVALLVIYLIKPQYKEKTVASTYVWKRVLLGGRKQFPVIAHVLIFILQAAAITLVALCLAQPYFFSREAEFKDSENILIIDASASMLAKPAEQPDGDSRFDRAIAAAVKDVERLFENGDGSVYVIFADSQPRFIVSGLGKEKKDEIYSALQSAECTFGESDLEGALNLARQRLEANPYAKINMYTDVQFGDMGTAFTCYDFADEQREWNAAILGCETVWRDNEYNFNVVLGAYGNVALKCGMKLEIKGAVNGGGDPENYTLTVPVTLEVNSDSADYESVKTFAVRATDERYGGAEGQFFDSFEEVKITLTGFEDSFPRDNEYLVYGGTRDVIKTEYWSSDPNEFWKDGLLNLANNMRSSRSITFDDIRTEYGMTVSNSGYDLYVFEHSIPAAVTGGGLPEDGIVILSDPDSSISRLNLGLTVKEEVSLPAATGCVSSAEHPLIRYFNPANVKLTRYTRLEISQDSLFLPVMFCNGDPVALVKNTDSSKIVVLPFSINMSDFFSREFQTFLYNVINYFLPLTLEKYDYSLNESARYNCKGASLEIMRDEIILSETQTFPAEYKFTELGTYVFKTKSGLAKPDEIRKVYVHIPISESSLFGISEIHTVLDNGELTGEVGFDVFLYLAAAALVIMTAEWYAQFRYIV